MGDSDKQLQQAHKFYMAAAANRDQDPETYEGARIRYMTLKNGPGWLEQEKTRINDTKLQPKIDEYRQQFQTLKSQAAVQSGLVDSIATVRDKQSALVSSTSSNFDFLRNLLEDKKTKMSAYDRFVELTTPAAYIHESSTGKGPAGVPFVSYFATFPSSFNIILDVIIAVLGLFLLVTVIGKSRSLFTGWSNFNRNLYTRASMAGPAPIVIHTPAPTR